MTVEMSKFGTNGVGISYQLRKIYKEGDWKERESWQVWIWLYNMYIH